MDISNSPPPETPGREWHVETVAEQVQAIDALIGLAQQRIQLFDIDLAQGGWSDATRADALARFLRQRNARLDVIVHDTRWIEATAPRFVQLLRQFGHAMTLYKTGAEARTAMDPLLIVDQRHFLHRFHIDRPRAGVAVDMPQAARPLVARFEEIWATGEPGLTGTVLGL
jgi:glycerophosphoryl diester phosphodiesterase